MKRSGPHVLYHADKEGKKKGMNLPIAKGALITATCKAKQKGQARSKVACDLYSM
jgi:hypothetical protein